MCSKLLNEFSTEPEELPHEADAWGVCLGTETAQISPAVFSRDPASVSNEEFNNHVTLIANLFFCKGKWERGVWNKLHVPQLSVWSCVCPWLPLGTLEAAAAPLTLTAIQSEFIGEVNVCPHQIQSNFMLL